MCFFSDSFSTLSSSDALFSPVFIEISFLLCLPDSALVHSASDPLIAYCSKFSFFSFSNSAFCLIFNSYNIRYNVININFIYLYKWELENKLCEKRTLAALSNSSCKLCPPRGFSFTSPLTDSLVNIVLSTYFSATLLKYWIDLRIIRLNRPSNCEDGRFNSSANLSTVLFCKPKPSRIA